MARIRSIKPEFWSDDKLGPLDPLTRLVFLGLVSQADDAGRLVDSPKRINGLLFPFTDDDCTPCICLLSTLGLISRGLTANLQPIIQIVGWTKHQKIEKPNIRAALPPIVPPSRRRGRLGETSGNDRGDVGDVSPQEGEVEVEVEGIQDLGGDSIRAREGSAAPDPWTPNDEHRARAAALGVDLQAEVRKYLPHRRARGMEPGDDDFAYWLERAPEFNRNGVPEPQPRASPPVYEPEPLPELSPEERAAGLALVRDAVKSLKAVPMPPPEIDDPEQVAAREARRIQQLELARRK